MDMNRDAENSIRNRVCEGLQAGNGNFLLLRHYNTLVLSESGKAQIKQENPDIIVCLHDSEINTDIQAESGMRHSSRTGIVCICHSAICPGGRQKEADA